VSLGGVTLAGVQITATVGGATLAYVGRGANLTAGNLAVSATATKADANATGTSIAVGLISGDGIQITASTTQTTEAFQDGGTAPCATGAARLPAPGRPTTTEATAPGVSASLVGLPFVDITPSAGGPTAATAGGELHAATLELTATSQSTATPTSTTVSV